MVVINLYLVGNAALGVCGFIMEMIPSGKNMGIGYEIFFGFMLHDESSCSSNAFFFWITAQPSGWWCCRDQYIRPVSVYPQHRVATSVRGLLKQALQPSLRLPQKGDYLQ